MNKNINIPTENIENFNDCIFDEHMDTNFYSDLDSFNLSKIFYYLDKLKNTKYSIFINKFDSENDNLIYLSLLIENKVNLNKLITTIKTVEQNLIKQKLVVNNAIKLYSE
jgi:hypothetical protein